MNRTELRPDSTPDLAELGCPHTRELNQELLKEEEGLTAQRGLVNSTANPRLADNQLFLMYVTNSIRKTYDAKMLQLVQQVRCTWCHEETLFIFTFAFRLGGSNVWVEG